MIHTLYLIHTYDIEHTLIHTDSMALALYLIQTDIMALAWVMLHTLTTVQHLPYGSYSTFGTRYGCDSHIIFVSNLRFDYIPYASY
jgi:hypothetical protein